MNDPLKRITVNPDMERVDIVACLAFAARLANVHRIVPLTA